MLKSRQAWSSRCALFFRADEPASAKAHMSGHPPLLFGAEKQGLESGHKELEAAGLCVEA